MKRSKLNLVKYTTGQIARLTGESYKTIHLHYRKGMLQMQQDPQTRRLWLLQIRHLNTLNEEGMPKMIRKMLQERKQSYMQESRARIRKSMVISKDKSEESL